MEFGSETSRVSLSNPDFHVRHFYFIIIIIIISVEVVAVAVVLILGHVSSFHICVWNRKNIRSFLNFHLIRLFCLHAHISLSAGCSCSLTL